MLALPADEVMAAAAVGEKLPLHVVGATTTTATGQFSLTAEPGSFPDWARAKGAVDLQLVVADETRELRFNYSVQATPTAQRKSLGRTWTALAGDTGPGRGAAPSMRVDLGQETAWETANDPADWLDATDKVFGADRRAKAAHAAVTGRSRQIKAAAAARDGSMSTMQICTVVAGDVKYNMKEHFLDVYAWSGAQGTVTESSGVDHTLGVGVTTNSGGSWSGSGTKTISLHSSGSQSSIENSSVWNRVNYRDYSYSCAPRTERRPLSYYDMLSNDWAQVAHVNQTASCVTKLAGASWSTSSAKNKTFGAGMDIGPINVSAQSGFNSSMDLTFNFTSKSKLCGNSSSGVVESSVLDTRAP